MESIYVSQKDMLEICQDGDKYFLRYPTFNITCPEVIREIPKEAADSYMSGEHTGKELMNYAQYGFWKSKKEYTQDESDKLFIEDHPSFILKNPENSRCLFTAEEFRQIVTQAISSELKPTELDAIGTVDNHLELLQVDSVDWEEEIEAVHLEIHFVLGIYQGRAYGTRISQLLDIVQKFLVRQVQLLGDIRHDTHIRLMADEKSKVIQRITGLLQQMKDILRHIGTSLDKYVTPLRHQDTAVTRTQVNRLHRFRQMAETLRVDLYDLSVALTDPLLGDKESGSGITP